MGLLGRLSVMIQIRSKGNLFHQLFGQSPHQVISISPNLIAGCDLHGGNWGTVGCVICWTYTHDGKKKIVKDVVEAIDEANKSVTFKVIEGDVLEQHKSFKLGLQVETNGDKEFVTWVLEYEKLNDDVEDPISLLPLFITLTKDVEAHHLKNTTT